MSVCMYVCMYVCILALPLCSPVFPAKKHCFSSVFADVQKHRVFPDFWQKDAGSPSQQKSRQGDSSLGPLFCDTGSPKTTFSGTSSNCRAVLGGGGGPPPPPPTYQTSGGGGVRGGGYPLSSLRCPTRREMSADTVQPSVRGTETHFHLSLAWSAHSTQVDGSTSFHFA